jgi:lysophospholipase L1-like esterase
MPKPVGFFERGIADILSITLIGFLVFSTLTILSVTINPNIKEIFSPKAAGTITVTDPMTGAPKQIPNDAEAMASYRAQLANEDPRAIEIDSNANKAAAEAAKSSSSNECGGVGQKECEEVCEGNVCHKGNVTYTKTVSTTTSINKVKTINGGYHGQDAVNTEAPLNGAGYDCLTRGGCAPGVEIAGYYRIGEIYYPIAGTGNDPNTYVETSLATVNKANYEKQMADKAAAEAEATQKVQQSRNEAALRRIDDIENKKPTTTVTTTYGSLGVAGGGDQVTNTTTTTYDPTTNKTTRITVSTIPSTQTQIVPAQGKTYLVTTSGNLDLSTGKFVGETSTKKQEVPKAQTASITSNEQGSVMVKYPIGTRVQYASYCESGYASNGICQEKPPQINTPPLIETQVAKSDQKICLGGVCNAYNPLPGNTNQIGQNFTTPQLSQVYLEGTEACKNNPNSTECKNWNTQITNEFKITAAALGGVFAAPAVFTAGSVGSAVATGFMHLGAISSVQQTVDATVAQVENPGSLEAWKQTGLAALSWTNLGTANYLIKTFSNTASTVQSLNLARSLNTGVSGINLVVDIPTAITTCTQEGRSVLDCAGSIVAVVADAGFGVIDYKQGQLSIGNPLRKISEVDIPSISKGIPEIHPSDPLAAAASNPRPVMPDESQLVPYAPIKITNKSDMLFAPKEIPATFPSPLAQAWDKSKETAQNAQARIVGFVDNLGKPKVSQEPTNPQPIQLKSSDLTFEPSKATDSMVPVTLEPNRPGIPGKIGTDTTTYSLGNSPDSQFRIHESSLSDPQLVKVTKSRDGVSVENTTGRTIIIDGRSCAPGQSVKIQAGSKIQADNTVSIFYNGNHSIGVPSFSYYLENARVATDTTPKVPLKKVHKVNGKNILEKAEEAEGLIVGQTTDGTYVLQRTNDSPIYYFDKENNAWVKANNIVLEDNLRITYNDSILSSDTNTRRDTPIVTIFKDEKGKFNINTGKPINRNTNGIVPLQNQNIFTSTWNKLTETTQNITQSPAVINTKGWWNENIKDKRGWLPKLRTENPTTPVVPIHEEVGTLVAPDEPYLAVAPPQMTNEKTWINDLPIKNLKGGKMGDVFDMGEHLERYASHWNGKWNNETKRIVLTPETNSNILKNGEFFYDRSLSVVENGEIQFLADSGYKPLVSDVYGHVLGDSNIPSTIDGEELIFRGINFEGMQSILQNNILESGPIMKSVGYTDSIYFSQNSERALGYAAEGEGYFAMATFERPSYIISIKKPSNPEIDFLGDVIVRDLIPIEKIQNIYEVRPYAMTEIRVPAQQIYTNTFGEKISEPYLYIPGLESYPLDGVPKARFAYREINLDEAKALFPEKLVSDEPSATFPKTLETSVSEADTKTVPIEVKPTVSDNLKTFLGTSNGKLAVGAAVNIVGGTILGRTILQNTANEIPKAIDFSVNLWQGVIDQIKSIFPAPSDKLPVSVDKDQNEKIKDSNQRIQKGEASVETSKQQQFSEAVPELPKKEEPTFSKTNVLILGDSLTQGYLSDSLYEQLKAAGYDIEFLGNQKSVTAGTITEGHTGYSTAAIVNALKAKEWLYDKNPQKVEFDKNVNLVVLQFGINDLVNKNDIDTKIIPNMQYIINYLRDNVNPNIKVVITSVPKFSYKGLPYTEDAEKLNNKFAELASQISTSDSPVIMGSSYASRYDLSKSVGKDGVHPNKYGADIIAESIVNTITNNQMIKNNNLSVENSKNTVSSKIKTINDSKIEVVYSKKKEADKTVTLELSGYGLSPNDKTNYSKALTNLAPFSQLLSNKIKIIKVGENDLGQGYYGLTGNDLTNKGSTLETSITFNNNYLYQSHLLRVPGLDSYLKKEDVPLASLVHEFVHTLKYETDKNGKYVNGSLPASFINYFYNGRNDQLLNEKPPTPYAQSYDKSVNLTRAAWEDLADSMALYLTAPEFLEKNSPERYKFLDYIANGGSPEKFTPETN